MPDPAPRIWLAVQRRLLDIDAAVLWVKVRIADCRCLTGDRICVAHPLEERWREQVHILTSYWKKATHSKCQEGAGGAGVVIAGQTGCRGVEGGWDVGVDPVARPSWSTGVVVLEGVQLRRLVADVEQARGVQVVESCHE